MSQMEGGGKAWIPLRVLMPLMDQLYAQSLQQHAPALAKMPEQGEVQWRYCGQMRGNEQVKWCPVQLNQQ